MRVFGIVLFLAILPNEWTKVSLAVRAQGASPPRQAPINAPLSVVTDFMDDVYASEMRAPICNHILPHYRLFFDVVLTSVPEVKSVSNAFGCCELCQKNTACQAWTRNRDTGECILGYYFDREVSMDPDAAYDGGYIDSRTLTKVAGITTEDVLIRPCPVATGVRFPRGNRVGEGRATGAVGCCNICRFASNCLSWYYSFRTQRCILNGNTPRRVSASSNFAGGAF